MVVVERQVVGRVGSSNRIAGKLGGWDGVVSDTLVVAGRVEVGIGVEAAKMKRKL